MLEGENTEDIKIIPLKPIISVKKCEYVLNKTGNMLTVRAVSISRHQSPHHKTL
jgi:hypothetical protein